MRSPCFGENYCCFKESVVLLIYVIIQSRRRDNKSEKLIRSRSSGVKI
jgi:hypothetical protein